MTTYLVPSAAELPSFETDRVETARRQPARGEGRGGDGHDRGRSGGHQRRRRRALASRRHGHPDAGDARASLDARSRRRRDDSGRVRLRGRREPEHAIELLGEAGGREAPRRRALAAPGDEAPHRPAGAPRRRRADRRAVVRPGGGRQVAIGALTRHKDVASAPVLREHCPIVSFTAGQVGDPQVRHRGTIGGSIAHGDPASDLPSVMLALDGELVARGPGGERAIPARDFFTGVFQTALAPDEMLVEIRVPKLGLRGLVVHEDGRRAQDWATVAVAAVVRRSKRRGRASVDRAHEHGCDVASGEGRGGGPGRRSVDRGRCRARGRGHRTSVGSGGERGFPSPSRACPHAARAGGSAARASDGQAEAARRGAASVEPPS